MNALILDTSGLYALLDAAEPEHERCIKTTSDFTDFVIPELVLVEVDYWCRKRGGGPQAFVGLMADVSAGAYRLEPMSRPDWDRAVALEVQYQDLDLGLVDASVVAICERLGVEQLLTLDRRDFQVVRPRHCAALHLLPD